MSKNKKNSIKECDVPSFLQSHVVPIFLIFISINLSLVLPYIVIHRNGDLIGVLKSTGLFKVIMEAWLSIHWKHWEYPLFILILLVWGAFSIILVPGDEIHGPFTTSGFRPVYRRNGLKFYIISMAYSVPLIGYFQMMRFYYEFVTLVGYLIATILMISALVYLKGLYGPSPGVFSQPSRLISDFFWGIELYPRLGYNLDFKILINSRFGFFLRQLIVLICGKANFELYRSSYVRGDINWAILTSITLQTIYSNKFYLWDDGYMDSLEITHYRFGFNAIFGNSVLIPVLYSLSPLYMVRHSPSSTEFDLKQATFTLFLGIIFISLTFWCDLQKKLARETNGKTTLWGKPAKVIHVNYLDEDNRTQRTVLLVSGFWSLARHINYFFELCTVVTWSIPVLGTNVICYFPLIYLILLFLVRIREDHLKCSLKYGSYWDQYCKLVPYRLIPFIY